MKIAVLIARILLGLAFLVFGLNHLHEFLPMPPMTGDAGAMAGLMLRHGWFTFYGVIQAGSGLFLLFGRFVPLGLTLLAGMIVNILLFDITLAPAGLALPVLIGLLEAFLVYAYRGAFAGIFAARTETA